MEIRAELNNLRISPRKARLVADAIRGKRFSEAEVALSFMGRHAAGPILKLLLAAAADARHNFQLTSSDALVVSRVFVNSGPTLKRSRPRAMGRAFPIRKHTSRVVLILESREPVAPKRRAKADIAMVRETDGAADAAEHARVNEKGDAFRAKPKVATKSTDFVQRMFRRKAI